jgi:hypothetical protein
MDVLLEQLKQAKRGCHIGNTFVGGLGVRRWCLFVGTTIVNAMLMICETSGVKFQVKCNSTKSHVTVCCNNITTATSVKFTLNGQNIDLQTSVTHLGYPVGNPEYKQSIIDNDISDMYARTNFVLTKFIVLQR